MAQDPHIPDAGARRYMKAVLITVLADKAVTEAEKNLVRRIQHRLQMQDQELRALIEQVKRDQTVEIPAEPHDRRAMFELMVSAAAADGQISPEERKLLEQVGEQLQISPGQAAQVCEEALAKAATIGQAGGTLPARPGSTKEEQAEALVDKFYLHLGEWPDAAQRARRFLELGEAAVKPLIQAFESYRVPDGCPDVTELHQIIAEVLGEVRDRRAAYYLAELLRLGDDDNELSNAPLRETVAEALGKIVGQDFPRSRAGVVTARQWWLETGRVHFRML
jgi:uncharacterized tellurite resistance protein B-like protein